MRRFDYLCQRRAASGPADNDPMTFGITILGCSAALPTARRHPSAQIVNVHEQLYLVDCGEGTQRRMLECGVNPLRLSAVFITHLHGDHSYGLFPLLSTMGLMGRRVPLRVFAPEPFGEILREHVRLYDLALPYEVIHVPVDTRRSAVVFENKVMEVVTVPLRHRVPCAGYLFREKTPPLNVRKSAIERYGLGVAQIAAAKRGEDVTLEEGVTLPCGELTYTPYEPRAYACLSDTLPSAKAAALVRGADLLYHEATFAHADRHTAARVGHSTTVQAAKIALKAEVKRLVLGHFSARYRELGPLLAEARELFPETSLAGEGETLCSPLRRNARE